MSPNVTATASENEEEQQIVVPDTVPNIVPSWRIFVKTVGKIDDRRLSANVEANSEEASTSTSTSICGVRSFNVMVSPDDRIDSLHEEIEVITGVKASQQRLIYRGRLIGKNDVVSSNKNSNNNDDDDGYESANNGDPKVLTTTCQQQKRQQGYKIKDIVGLCDGQTIHLVKKRHSGKTENNNDTGEVDEEGISFNATNNNNNDSTNINSNSSTTTESELGGSGGGALLAALLGLSLAEDSGPSTGPESASESAAARLSASNSNRNTNSNSNTNTNPTIVSPWRSSRAAGNNTNNNGGGDTASSSGHSHRQSRNRRPHYRLVAEDLEVSDPGTMESVRQGLMTVNTIMNSQPQQPSQSQQQPNMNMNMNNSIAGRGVVVCEEGRRRSTHHQHHPLEVNREWFRGQWIDARDTVNQWLEATVVDILNPRDVLSNDAVLLHSSQTPPTAAAASTISAISYGSSAEHQNRRQPQQRQRRVPNLDNDPAISANDIEGRRRLLLEECEPGDPEEIIIGGSSSRSSNANAGTGTGTGTNSNESLPPSTSTTQQSQSFRPRSNNYGAQLLLIHYNGWPHRWDEWIRSDSERLRPFRTRTRHPNMSSMASPTPQSVFTEAPRTNIRDGDEEEDRFALLPELNVAISRVSELLGNLVHREQEREHGENNQSRDCDEDELEDLRPSTSRRLIDNANTNANVNHRRAKADLPWIARDTDDDDEKYSTGTSKSKQDDGSSPSVRSSTLEPKEDDDETENVDDNEAIISEQVPPFLGRGRDRDPRTMYSQRELRNLATLFDRLGRTLTDAAPHIASLAASLPEQEQLNNPSSDHQLDSIISENANPADFETSSAPLGGLLSLWSRERERRRHILNQENAATRSTTTTIDPDHLDFASGVVNTSRGEVRSGPRSRPSHQDDVASLLGTYLAAASLGSVVGSNDDNSAENSSGLARLLQRGSSGASGDNGIDIHIHAIVTAPGVSPGGMGIATVSSGGSSPTATLGGARNLFSSNRGSVRAGGRGLWSGTSLSSNIVEPADEEDYTDLFSELYSESPTPIDPNGSPGRGESEQAAVISPTNRNRDDDTDNDLSSTILNNSDEQQESSGDLSLVTPPGNRSRPSLRRQSAERRSGVFRLFRRRSSRANNQDGPNNEET